MAKVFEQIYPVLILTGLVLIAGRSFSQDIRQDLGRGPIPLASFQENFILTQPEQGVTYGTNDLR